MTELFLINKMFDVVLAKYVFAIVVKIKKLILKKSHFFLLKNDANLLSNSSSFIFWAINNLHIHRKVTEDTIYLFASFFIFIFYKNTIPIVYFWVAHFLEASTTDWLHFRNSGNKRDLNATSTLGPSCSKLFGIF